MTQPNTHTLQGARPSLAERLASEPYRFEFFQALRLLEVFHPERAPVAHGNTPDEEVARLTADPSLAFPTGQIRELARRDGWESAKLGPAPKLSTTFLGLVGSVGVLPWHYSALVETRRQLRPSDPTLAEFLDIWHHRALSFFHAAWEKHHFPFAYERAHAVGRWRPRKQAKDDLFTSCLYALVGLAPPATRNRLAVDDEALLYYAGHFSHRPRNAIGLQQIVGDFFELRAEVRQFVGQWLQLRVKDRTAMPSDDLPGGQNCQLGVSTVVGSRAWTRHTRFRIRLGPLRLKKFQHFLPAAEGFARLVSLVKCYAGQELDFDVQLVLDRRDVACTQLGRGGDSPRLGWNIWSTCSEMQDHADEAIFEPASG